MLYVSPVLAINTENCTSKIFKRFQDVHKTGHNKAHARPKGALLGLSREFGIQCPWQLEGDFNNDKRVDWIGVAEKGGLYYLIAYLSGTPEYKVQQLKRFSKFPGNVHLSTIDAQRLAEITKSKTNKFSRHYLVINQIDENAMVYMWNSTQLVPFHQYEGEFKDAGNY